MQFNEFMRRLDKTHLDRETKFLLIHMFEVQVEFSKYLDIMTDLVSKLADRVHVVADVGAETRNQVRELKRRGMADGIDVHSVVNDPEDGHG